MLISAHSAWHNLCAPLRLPRPRLFIAEDGENLRGRISSIGRSALSRAHRAPSVANPALLLSGGARTAGRSDIAGTVDERHYLATHPDVRAAVDQGHLQSGTEHYIISGYFERRAVKFPRTQWGCMNSFDPHEIVATGDFMSERRDVLSILWAITKGCNYRCSYCVYTRELKHTQFSSRDDLLGAAQTIARMGRPGYQLTLYGGEPTQHPHFLDLLEYLPASASPISLRMYTNGSRSTRFFDKVMFVTHNIYFGVIFSFHPEYTKFEQFIRNVELTACGGMSVGISFMFVPAFREQSRRHMEEFLALRSKVPFFVSINYPYTPSGEMGGGCSVEDFAWINESRQAFDQLGMPDHLRTPFYTRLMSKIALERCGKRVWLEPQDSLLSLAEMRTPSYKDYFCCGGTNVLFIEEDGAVRGGVCDASPPMGNIFRDSEIAFVQSMRPVRCSQATCASIENIPLPKFRSKSEAEACTTDFRSRAKAYLYRAEAARLRSNHRSTAAADRDE
jgi:MoaA/NifB/PqqE/SkfB family radical SAM enzyme